MATAAAQPLTPRPTPLRVVPEGIPEELKRLAHWVLWRYELTYDGKGTAKWTKEPFQPNGGHAASTKPDTWTTFDEALATYQAGGFDGIGIALTPEIGIVGIDLDHVVRAEGGMADWARDIVRLIDSRAEWSPSGQGLRIFAFGTLPPGRRKHGNVEIYNSGRYLTITGHHLEGTPATLQDRHVEIARWHAAWEQSIAPTGPKRDMPNTPTEDDAGLVVKARAARNGDVFGRLWDGDTALHGDDHSAADLALCGHLRFWTQADPAAIDRLFRQSGLMRPKWDERHGAKTYGQMTIEKALIGGGPVYTPSPQYVNGNGNSRHAPPPGSQNGHHPEPPKAPAHTPSDAGNGELFAALHGGHVRYDYARQRWLLFDTHHWRADRDGAVRRMAKETARHWLRIAADTEDRQEREQLMKWARASESAGHLESMLSRAESEHPIADTGEGWDADPALMGVPNGVVDLRTGALRDGRPEDKITLVTTTDYKPEAKAPRWLQFLSEVFAGDEALIGFVRRAIGYSITAETREQVAFWNHGSGANGKSVLLDTIYGVLGDYAHNLPMSALDYETRAAIPADIAQLPGKRFVTASESNEAMRLNTARLKALTGEETLTVSEKYKAPFQFRPVGKYWLTTNHLPSIKDDSYANWRRVRLIPFNVQFTGEKADPLLRTKLLAEREGILAWMVAGAGEWYRDGLASPDSVIRATSEWKDQADPLADFLQEKCVLTPQAQAKSSALYKAYTAYGKEQGIRERDVLSATAFGLRLGARVGRAQRTKSGMVYHGVGLISDGFSSDGEGSSDSGVGFEVISQNFSRARALRGEVSEKPFYPTHHTPCTCHEIGTKAVLGVPCGVCGRSWWCPDCAGCRTCRSGGKG